MGHNLMLKEHLKRMVNKATTMGWTTKQVHTGMDNILKEYGVGNFFLGTAKGISNADTKS